VIVQPGLPLKSSANKLMTAIGLIVIGLAFAAAGIYVGETDDAPGAAMLGFVLMITLVVIGIRIARRNPQVE
jgi:hypothetical protein